MTVPIVREPPRDLLTVEVTPPGGAPVRWGDDAYTPSNILSNLEFDDEMPGGYKGAQNVLNRDPQHSYPDVIPYGDAVIYGAGGEIVWRGYFDKASEVSGSQGSISPTFLGYQSVLEDNKACNLGIIDGDLSKWGSPSPERTKNLLGAGHPNDGQITAGVSLSQPPSVMITLELEAEGFHRGEVWNYAGGVDIGQLRFDFVASGEDTAWEDLAGLAADSNASSVDLTPDYNQVTHFNQILNATQLGRKYALLVTDRQGAFGVPTNISHYWENVKIIGTHGLTPLGTWPNIGYSSKQILLYFVNNFLGPLIATEESVEDDGVVISQAWYPNTESSAIIKDVTKYSLFDWFVYNSRLFEYRQAGTYGRFWKAYVVPSDLNEIGVDSTRLWRSIVVSYQEQDGTVKTVGPPGSGANYETSSCEIQDPRHPAVLANRTRRSLLALKGIGSPAIAVKVAERFLEEANLLNRSGSATLPAFVIDNKGILHPSSHVKSGDYVSFVDASDDGYRKIINKNYTHQTRSAEIDIDAPASGLEALLERLQAKIIELGVG